LVKTFTKAVTLQGWVGIGEKPRSGVPYLWVLAWLCYLPAVWPQAGDLACRRGWVTTVLAS
jgi:hypothetical protein